ncbi:MAG: extracellular solute-binding protein [Planctomycetota bacterium]
MARRRIPLTVEAGLLVLPVLLFPLLLFGFSSREERFVPGEPPARTLQLVIASPQWEGIKFEFEEGFRRWLYEKRRLGVEVRWIDVGGGATTLRWIQEQFRQRPDGIDVDLFFGGGTDPYDTLKEAGLLQRYEPDPDILRGVPERVGGFPILDPDRFWFGTALTGFGIMVNSEVIRWVDGLKGVEVKGWDDLADPRLRGWVGAADPRGSSSFHTLYEILLQVRGFEQGLRLIRLMGANVAAYSRFSAEVPKLCAVGQVACSMTIDHYARAQIDQVGPAIRFVLPEGETLVNADAVAILKGAGNQEAARLFVDFLLSDEAGRLWMLRKGEPGGPVRHPLNRACVRPGLYELVEGRSNVRVNPFRMRFSFRYDYPRAALRWNLLNDLLGALVIDTRAELRAAVEAYQQLEGAAKARAGELLFENPVTEQEALEMAALEWKSDESFRERKKIEWRRFAGERYAAVADLLVEEREE